MRAAVGVATMIGAAVMANLAGSRVHGGWLMVGAVVVFYGAARATMGELDRRNTRPL